MSDSLEKQIYDLLVRKINLIRDDIDLDEFKLYDNLKEAVVNLKKYNIFLASQITQESLKYINSKKISSIILLLIINQEYIGNRINQLNMLEMVIKTFYEDGLDLFNINAIEKCLHILNKMFEDWFKSYNRKVLGSKIRQSKNLIAIRQGKYIHKSMINVSKNSIHFLIKEIQFQLSLSDEVYAEEIYNKYKYKLCELGILNSHYMFSLLKLYFANHEDIIFYRNTYVKKFINANRREADLNEKN